MSTPLLSIVIPTYTREDMLQETLQSVLNQSYLPKDKIEIVISNDCSKDNTKSVLDDFKNAHEDMMIFVHHHENNLGGAGNWNFCLQQAKGEYVYLLSDDDHIDRDFLKEQLGVLEEDPEIDLVFCGFQFCDKEMNFIENGSLTHDVGVASGFARVTQQMHSHHMVMSSIYRTKILREASGWNARYGVHIDCAAFCRTAIRCKKTFYIDRPLFKYRIMPGSWASFNPDKQKLEYQKYRFKIDDLVQDCEELVAQMVPSMKEHYLIHARSIINNLEIKFAHGNISKVNLRRVLRDILEVYPEVDGDKSYMKLMLSSYIGLSWLKLIRVLLNKPNPYQGHMAMFENAK